MNDSNGGDLVQLRGEIDRIDAALARLLAERQAVSASIGRFKTDEGDVLRPGREAQILRRLVNDLADRVEPAAVLRVWREILAASARAQTPFSAAVCAPTGEREMWDLARDHFGGVTPLQRVDRPPQALRALLDDSVHAAVLPPPSDDLLWWTGLIESVPRLHVVGRLPFGVPQQGEGGDYVEAFVVGRMLPDASGDDVTLLAVHAAGGLSRGRLKDLLADVGLEAASRAATRPPASQEAWHLMEIDGYLDLDDQRLVELRHRFPREIERSARIGAYARPMVLPAPVSGAGPFRPA